MKLAVITEVSTAAKNSDIIQALTRQKDLEVVNLGMTGEDDTVKLTYMTTSFMSALLLNNGMVDLVVGGCGTGQGYLNAVLKYPGIVAGLLQDPLDGWLFSQINAGNCISLALNKGYGWAGDIGLEYLFEKLFKDLPGAGYPPARSDSQKASREMLAGVDKAVHLPFEEIITAIDPVIVKTAFAQPQFKTFVAKNLPDNSCRQALEKLDYI